MAKMFITIFISFLLLSFLGCSGNNGKNHIECTFTMHDTMAQKWEDVFTDHTVLKFTFPKPGRELMDIRGFVINSKGDYIIHDAKSTSIIQFHSDGYVIRYIGNYGEGPGEYLMCQIAALDRKDNLFVFDLMKRQFIRYDFPNYSYKDQFKYYSIVNGQLVVDLKGNFISYSLDDETNQLICSFNPGGKVLKRTFSIEDKKYIFFIKRFGMGRVNDYPGKGFLFMDPQKYRIHLFDYDLNLTKVIYPKEPSKFFPFRENFPNSLSPYEFSPKHAKWWEKSLVPHEVRLIGENVLIGVLNKCNKYSVKQYVNIHDLNGLTYATGLEVPFNGYIKLTRGSYIYILEEDRLTEKGDIIPQKLHRYKIKSLLSKK
jgi:hypothetical protein